MTRILVTNDDGVDAPGLLALKQALGELGDVVVLAPDRNWSASSHMITMHMPLRVRSTRLADGSEAYCSTGSPSDCVALAFGGAIGPAPDLVVSGVNAGYNLGIDVTYSGTVACALEAAIKGAPGIAVSTYAPFHKDHAPAPSNGLSAQLAAQLAERVLRHKLPPHTLLNLNVPPVERAALQGIRITRMGGRSYGEHTLTPRQDPRGGEYFWLGGAGAVDLPEAGTDVEAILNGYASVTPIELDMTAYSVMDALQSWEL